jgi:hypothetical protein
MWIVTLLAIGSFYRIAAMAVSKGIRFRMAAEASCTRWFSQEAWILGSMRIMAGGALIARKGLMLHRSLCPSGHLLMAL